MKSEFADRIGQASKALQQYLSGVQTSLSTGTPTPPFPATLSDDIAFLAGNMSRFSGHQATIAESKMNREVEGLRGMARADVVSKLTRQDFYSNSTSFLDSEVTQLDTQLPVTQAVVDAAHPTQTGGLT